jgi:hypothetical protein
VLSVLDDGAHRHTRPSAANDLIVYLEPDLDNLSLRHFLLQPPIELEKVENFQRVRAAFAVCAGLISIGVPKADIVIRYRGVPISDVG